MLLGTRSTTCPTQTKSKPDSNTSPTPKPTTCFKGDKSKNNSWISSTKKTKPSSSCTKSVIPSLIQTPGSALSSPSYKKNSASTVKSSSVNSKIWNKSQWASTTKPNISSTSTTSLKPTIKTTSNKKNSYFSLYPDRNALLRTRRLVAKSWKSRPR